MKRGEVRWCEFCSPVRPGPAIIVTRDSAIDHLSSVTVAPVMVGVPHTRSEVPLTEDVGLSTPCVAAMDGIQTIPKGRIGHLITALSPSKLEELQRAIAFALELDELVD